MEEGAKNGEYLSYDRDGKLILQGHFMNGLLHGDNVGYYPDGAVQHQFTQQRTGETETGASGIQT